MSDFEKIRGYLVRLTNCVVPSELIDDIQSYHGGIFGTSRRQIEKILCSESTQGRAAASSELFNLVLRSRSGWLKPLIFHLCNNGHDELAKDISPHLCDEWYRAQELPQEGSSNRHGTEVSRQVSNESPETQTVSSPAPVTNINIQINPNSTNMAQNGPEQDTEDVSYILTEQEQGQGESQQSHVDDSLHPVRVPVQEMGTAVMQAQQSEIGQIDQSLLGVYGRNETPSERQSLNAAFGYFELASGPAQSPTVLGNMMEAEAPSHSNLNSAGQAICRGVTGRQAGRPIRGRGSREGSHEQKTTTVPDDARSCQHPSLGPLNLSEDDSTRQGRNILGRNERDLERERERAETTPKMRMMQQEEEEEAERDLPSELRRRIPQNYSRVQPDNLQSPVHVEDDHFFDVHANSDEVELQQNNNILGGRNVGATSTAQDFNNPCNRNVFPDFDTLLRNSSRLHHDGSNLREDDLQPQVSQVGPTANSTQSDSQLSLLQTGKEFLFSLLHVLGHYDG